MTIEEKGKLIQQIIIELKASRIELANDGTGKRLDEGDTFFSLCFKSDDELKHIAALCGIK